MAVDDLIEVLDEDELFEQFATDAATGEYPVDILGMQPERLAPAMLHVEAKAHNLWQTKRRQIVQSAWLRSARGDALTLLARGFFRLERIPATRATHQVRLTDTGGVGPVNITAGERVAYASNGQDFRNDDAIVVPLNGYVDAEFTAEEAGSLGNVAAGAITRLRQPIVGVTISNPVVGSSGGSLISAGRDEETDEQLIQRCEDRWSSTGSGGNEAAYRFWVTEAFTSAGDVPTITRVKIRTNNPYGFGSIGVIIANASGTATAGEIAQVDAYLQARKALGSGELIVTSAAAQSVLVSGIVYVDSGYDQSVVLAAVEAALDAYESEFAIGEKVYRAEVIKRVMEVDGVYNVALADPTGDTTVNANAIVSFTYSLTASA